MSARVCHKAAVAVVQRGGGRCLPVAKPQMKSFGSLAVVVVVDMLSSEETEGSGQAFGLA